jgi:3'-5' exonuclease
MNNIYLDIETIPNQSPEYRAEVRRGITAPAQYKKPESIEKWIAENGDAATDEKIAKTSFDPALGHICCLAAAIDGKDVCYWEARDVSDERDILEAFFAYLPDQGLNRIIGHYVSGFDIRFILCRAIVLRVNLPSKVAFPRNPKPWGDEVFDTMIAWSGVKGSISQDNLCTALDIPGKDNFDGSMVAEAWQNGEYGKIARYCMADVQKVRAIHNRFELVGF